MSAVAPALPRGAHVGAEAELRQAPAILLPYQQVWVKDDAKLKVAEKSRRIGLSWAEAADDALHAASQDGSNVYYMSYEMSMTRQFIEDCAWWAKWYGLAASEMYEDVWVDDKKEHQVFRIDFASGWHIQALSSAPRNLRSKQGRAVFDEYAFTDPAKQAELLKAGLAFLIWGGDVRVISTHDGVANGFNTLIEEIRAKKRPGSVHRITFDEAIQQGLYRRIALLKGLDPSAEAERQWADDVRAFYGEGAAEELDVVPSKGGGKYFSRVLVEDCMSADVPVLRLALDDAFAQLGQDARVRRTREWCDEHLAPVLERLDPEWKSFFGMDFGRVADLSYLLCGQLDPFLNRQAAFALEMRNVPFKTQEYVVDYICDRLPRFAAGALDAGGNGAALAEAAAQRWGFQRIHQVKLNPTWYIEQFPRYRSHVQDRRLVLPLDADLLDDHGDVELVAGVPRVPDTKRRKGSDGGYRHGDGAIAGVLFSFASDQGGAPIESQSLGARAGAASLDRYAGTGAPSGAGRFTDTGFGTVSGGSNLSRFL